MNWFQIVFTSLFIVWLFVSAYLLWRHAIGGAAHVNRLHLILNENTAKGVQAATDAAQSAHAASDAAMRAVEINARLVALLESEQSRKDASGA